MSWKSFFGRSKQPASQPTRLASLDKKLVQTVQSHNIPRFTQLKYLAHFLNAKEKLTLNLAIAGLIVGLMGAFGVYLSWHLDSSITAGGTYSEALIGEPKYINPLFASVSDVDADLTALIYAGLFRYDKNQILQPEIAESYEVNTSSKIYTVHLRHDVRFADNEPLTASDVVYTFDLIQNPEVASPLISSFQGVLVERVDDYTVRFTLKEPFAPFLSSLTVGILPEHIWGEFNPASIRLAKNNIQPIGAGPWQFSKLLKTDNGAIASYTLTKNEYYFKQKPYFDTIQFKFFDNYVNALEAVRSGLVDAVSFLPHNQKEKLNAKTIALYELYLPQYTGLFFNQTAAPILKDDALRASLARAINKNQIIEAALSGDATPIDSPLLPGTLGYSAPLVTTTPSLDDDNALLDKKWTRIEPEEYFKIKHDALLKPYLPTDKTATTTSSTAATEELEKIDASISASIRNSMDSSQTFYRRDKDNTILELTITTGDTPEYDAAAQQIAKMWGKLGIQTFVEKVNPHQLVRTQIKNRSYQILLYGEIVGSDPDPFPFWHSSQVAYPGLNISLYNNRTVDGLLENARSTTDDKKRADLYSKFAEQLKKDIPAIFLYSPIHTMAINKSIKGVDLHFINSPADRYDDLSNWYSKTKLKWKN